MAIKIIKEGKIPERKFRATCKRCGTVFEFLDTDAMPDYKELDRLIFTINCPVCGEIIKVDGVNDMLKEKIQG